MSVTVGIDLGTSNSEISVMENGEIIMIPNSSGKLITPSVLHKKEDGSFLIGEEAVPYLILEPQNTVMEVKRQMGEDLPLVLRGEKYTPIQLSALLIGYLVESAQLYLQKTVTGAVITVPAYFSDRQRRETVEAGKLAGVTVERILNEPTAAAMDYGLSHMQERSYAMVYDFGGGTFDVTILELFDGVIEVKASSGNNHLGGKEFDQILINELANRFEAKNKLRLSENMAAMARLKAAAVQCKEALSDCESYTVNIPFLLSAKGQAFGIQEEISRAEFTGWISETVQSTGEPVLSALRDAELELSQLDMVLLVGGSTKIPYVAQFVRTLTGKDPVVSVDPELAVARGAAIQSAVMGGTDNGLIITDVCPYTLGVEALMDPDEPAGFSEIIKRNQSIPSTVRKIYSTCVDRQRAVCIKVYQGEFRTLERNQYLGECLLDGIPARPAGEKIEIAFSYDLNGLLQVTGTVLSTGKSVSLALSTTGVELQQEVDVSDWEAAPLAKKYRAVIRKAQRCLAGLYAAFGEGSMAGSDLSDAILALKVALVKNSGTDELNQLKDDLMEELLVENADE